MNMIDKYKCEVVMLTQKVKILLIFVILFTFLLSMTIIISHRIFFIQIITFSFLISIFLFYLRKEKYQNFSTQLFPSQQSRLMLFKKMLNILNYHASVFHFQIQVCNNVFLFQFHFFFK